MGDLMRKGTAYDVWALDPDPASSSSSGGSSGGNANASASANDSGDPDPSAAQVVVAGVGAEELNGLSVLLPRKRKGGKLYLGAFRCARVLCVFFFWFGRAVSIGFFFFQLKSLSSGILSSLRAPRGPQDQRLPMRRPSGRRILMKC